MSCANARSFAATDLLYLDPATAPGPPVCLAIGAAAGQLPDKTSPEPWSIQVLYVPPGVNLATSSFDDVLAAGGVDVETRFGYNRDRLPTDSNPTNQAGGYALFSIGSTSAVVQQHNGQFVTASWLVPSGSGQQIEYVIGADADPSSVVRLAQRSKHGLPVTTQPTPTIADPTTTTVAPTTATTFTTAPPSAGR